MRLAVDGMAARARRLAESEAEQHERERRARAEWNSLASRAAALGRAIPEDTLGRFGAVLAARARAVEIRRAAVDAFENSLADWRARLDRVEDDDRALAALRDRLHRTLADEVSELNPAELSRVVARALGDRRTTGPLRPLPADAAPAAGVEQEAMLLGRLLADGDDDRPETPRAEPPTDPRAQALARPAPQAAGAPETPSPIDHDALRAAFDGESGPLDTLVGELARPPRRPSATRTVEAARIDDFEVAAPLPPETDPPAGAESDDDSPRRRPRSLMRDPQTDERLDVDIEIEVEADDEQAGEEVLARWLGRPSDPPPAPAADDDGVEASIDALDEADSLLEWEATGLGNEVAMLVERRRPSTARTSIIEVVEDPFDAFDDFDDSLDAPFGFVDHVTGQGPALPDADWSFDEDAGPLGPGLAAPRPPEPEPAPAADGADQSFEMLMLDDPFDESSDDGPPPAPSTVDGSTDPEARGEPSRPALETGELDGVDMEEAFAIAAPLGADSMEDPPVELLGEATRGFEAALDDAFARSGPDAEGEVSDSLDADLEAAFADGPFTEPAPASPEPEPPPAIRITDRPTAQPRSNYDPLASPPGGSLLPAPPDPGADGWGPRPLAEQRAPDAAPPEPTPAPEDDLDHVPTDFGAALIDPAIRNPFESPQVTLPAPAPRMSGPQGATAGSTASESQPPGPAVGARPPADSGFDFEAALADAGGGAFDADVDFPDDDGFGETCLTGLDWPPPRALDAFPDSSVDRPATGPADPAEARLADDRPFLHGAGVAPRAVGDMGDGIRGAPDDSPDSRDGIPAPRGGTPNAHGTSESGGPDPEAGGGSSVTEDGGLRRVVAESPAADAMPRHPGGLSDASDQALGAAVEDALDDVMLDDAWGGLTGPSGAPIPRSAPAPLVLPSAAALPDPDRGDDWRSAPAAPTRRSASLADALHRARARDELDAALDDLEAPADDERRRVTDRFAALAGALGADPWADLDISDRSAGDPDRLPELMRRRRQGRPLEPARPLPPAAPRPPAAEPEEESAPRAPLGVRVGLEAGDRFFTGFSRDISVDGIFVGTQHALGVGEAVEVFFELPGGRSVNARGLVRRMSRSEGGPPNGLGIRFKQLTREARVQIGRYVARTLTGKIPLP